MRGMFKVSVECSCFLLLYERLRLIALFIAGRSCVQLSFEPVECIRCPRFFGDVCTSWYVCT